ncbi:MAG: NADP-specific glutamate dehydrogenase [Micavibrio sp.]|nr:NADP-specific glutamate dehydrogenase [Micavibrio sp.]
MTLNNFLSNLENKNPGQSEYLQAVRDVYEDVFPWLDNHKDYTEEKLPERLAEPDRTIAFRITWRDGKGNIQINKGWRVQHNNALGAYKGGLRFKEGLRLDTLKFLAFEQTFKDALTGLPMGGAKGGSDFNPKNFDAMDIERFCQAYMLELYRHIGPDIDVPAGDIGVGSREIGYLFGTYKKIENKFQGALTGKSPAFGGSCIREEATGYGTIYFLKQYLENSGGALQDKKALISGAGNVALFAAQKLLDLDVTVKSVSDSDGTLEFKEGLTHDLLNALKELKFEKRGRLSEMEEGRFKSQVRYHKDKQPWGLEGANIAIPAATQNEIGEKEAKDLLDSGVETICEASNMPLTSDATKYVRGLKTMTILPAKAVNAGGVAVSGLERSQNAEYQHWSADKVDEKLQSIMSDIFKTCLRYGEGDFVKGANIAGFERVAKAVIAYGAN